MDSLIFFIIVVLLVVEVVWSPRPNLLLQTGVLLLWYNGVNDRGEKVRMYKKYFRMSKEEREVAEAELIKQIQIAKTNIIKVNKEIYESKR